MNLLDSLDVEFRTKIEKVLMDCENSGFFLKPYFGLRTPWEQARLWRQSRSTPEVIQALELLRSEQAFWLAKIFQEVGPQYGRWATNCLPGQSWHQYGMAIDCYVVERGKVVWNPSHPGYIKYARIAQDSGLTSGRFWKVRDTSHVQGHSRRVLDTTDWRSIDSMMRDRFWEGEKNV